MVYFKLKVYHDADSIAMCKIAELRDYVDLYVMHKVEEEDVFPASGYIDVGGDHRMDDEGQHMVLYGGEHPGSKHAEAAADISGAENSEGGDDVNLEADMGNYNDNDSVDSEYKPSEEEEETEDDSNFTNSEDELDPDVSGFQDVNVANKKCRAGKKKGVATDNFGDEDVARSDELENDHEVGGDVSDSENQGQSYPWEVGTLYASREEFKDTVTAYAVQTARAITFRKCDLQRVRAVCTGECPFWVYAAKMKEEDTWQLCSMNLSHTCTQAHRVGIMHSRWLGKGFKKKVSSNPKVKIRELVSKAQKKWNLTVTKSMATRTKQIALDEIQGTFREQYKRIYDYAHEVMRANPGSSVRIQVQRYLNAIPPRYWSRSRFTYNSKVDTLVNNMSERFNAAIVDAREKPILTMLEDIRVKLMTRWAENRDLAQNYAGTILPRIRIKLERRSRSAGEWRPYWSAAQKYEVVSGLDKFTVDLGSFECSCRRWQLSGIPCVHAISCIKFKGFGLEPYVADCYKIETYLKCYEAAQNSKDVSKGKQSRGSNKSNPLVAKGGKKTASTQPTPKLTVNRKVTSATQPPTSAQSNTVAQLKRPRGRPKGTTKPTSSAQHDPPPKTTASPKTSAPSASSSQPTTTTLPASQPSIATASNQPTGHFSVSLTGGPHVSPRKLKLMAKLPPRKWGLL
ncbi:hypothetical protein Ahy_A02g006008 [Arachis hypogaea]|uniref:SWIM-type domain-containing protein n=1 Tax=Arachis hypogaea TaxID=3818 RepID=A0A445E8D7_ARAHY|nr:hypothetical protein Ahy_A02g006008 [Arachis hypogaea]